MFKQAEPLLSLWLNVLDPARVVALGGEPEKTELHYTFPWCSSQSTIQKKNGENIRFLDFQAEYDLARITWDEARHTEIGHRALLAAGYDPFELRNRLTSSTCRGPMEPAYAMAEINLFGKVGVLKTINGLIDTAREKDDSLLFHIADFIRSDERTHVRKGQHILKCMTTLGSQELELKTRELFTECLVSLGAVKPDMDLFIVSREDIEHLVGE